MTNMLEQEKRNKEGLIEAIGKTPKLGNPLVSHKFGADPFALVFEGRVYLYATNDVFEYDEDGNVMNNTYGKIKSLTIISSDDLVNWTDHGEVELAGENGPAKWAANSWAPAVAHKKIDGKDKFFIYFANNGSNVGVVSGDSPVGPFEDPINKPIISRDMEGTSGIPWLFDPAVLVDDDGSAYLYFGGGVPDEEYAMPNTSRCVKLADDMVSTTGEIKKIDAPYMFENSGIHKYNDTYYYTYCSNFYTGEREEDAPAAGEIVYMTSKHPLGPFTYKKSILKNPGYFFDLSGNNHHAIFPFKDKWYIAYHAQTLSGAMGVAKGYRSTHLNEVTFDEHGEINVIEADREGVAAVKHLDPSKPVIGVTYAWQAGMKATKSEALDPGYRAATLKDGGWLGYKDVELKDNLNVLQLKYSGTLDTGSIEVRVDDLSGKKVGETLLPLSHEREGAIELSIPVDVTTGVTDFYLIFRSDKETERFQLIEWKLTSEQ